MRGRHVSDGDARRSWCRVPVRQSRNDRKPYHRQPSRVSADPLRDGAARGCRAGRGQLLRAGERKTGVVNLHVAPGLGNALGMLYNALKGRLAARRDGGPARYALAAARALAGPRPGGDGGSRHQVERPGGAGRRDGARSCVARSRWRRTRRAAPSFVALPIDVLEQETDQPAEPPATLYLEHEPDPKGVAAAAALLLASRRPAIVAGDDVSAPRRARRIAGARRAARRRRVGRGPATARDAPERRIRTIGARCRSTRLRSGRRSTAPTPCCWSAGRSSRKSGSRPARPSSMTPRSFRSKTRPIGSRAISRSARDCSPAPPRVSARCASRSSATAGPRCAAAAAERNAALRALRTQDMTAQRERAAKRWDAEPISIPRLMAEIETALPPDAIVVDEAITASIDMARAVSFERPGDYFGARGGGIGQGLPGALGVKFAYPEPTRSSPSPATDRPCTASRRCGRRPTTISP